MDVSTARSILDVEKNASQDDVKEAHQDILNSETSKSGVTDSEDDIEKKANEAKDVLLAEIRTDNMDSTEENESPEVSDSETSPGSKETQASSEGNSNSEDNQTAKETSPSDDGSLLPTIPFIHQIVGPNQLIVFSSGLFMITLIGILQSRTSAFVPFFSTVDIVVSLAVWQGVSLLLAVGFRRSSDARFNRWGTYAAAWPALVMLSGVTLFEVIPDIMVGTIDILIFTCAPALKGLVGVLGGPIKGVIPALRERARS